MQILRVNNRLIIDKQAFALKYEVNKPLLKNKTDFSQQPF